MDIAGAAAIVTGGASGLGAATARRLAGAGMRVIIADLQDDSGNALAAEIGARYVHADVGDTRMVAAAVDAAVEIAPLRVLVNCAGVGPAARTINRDSSPHDLDLFRKVVDINLVGTFNTIRLAAVAIAATDPMDDDERGAIINTASVAAFDGQIGQVAYSASKAGIAGMTLPVARELASRGIRVNTIAPGIFGTPLFSSLPESARVSLEQQVLHPRRLGAPDEFAALAHFLVTQSYMNGETIRMDGGIRMAPK